MFSIAGWASNGHFIDNTGLERCEMGLYERNIQCIHPKVPVAWLRDLETRHTGWKLR